MKNDMNKCPFCGKEWEPDYHPNATVSCMSCLFEACKEVRENWLATPAGQYELNREIKPKVY